MRDNHFKLTATAVAKRCVPPTSGTRAFYWDTELKGLALIVSKPNRSGEVTRSFIVQKDIHGRSVRVTIGRSPAWTADEARRKARELIVKMDEGTDPNREARQKAAKGITLAEAIDMHAKSMRAKHANERSIETIREELERHVLDWMGRSLTEIKKNDCAQRHERITEKAGPYAANRVFASFRACYNTATKRMDDMPPNPVLGVTFNKQKRRRSPIRWEELADWRAKVDGIENPVRRDLQLFVLFTGLRATDARTVKWEDINLGEVPVTIHGDTVMPGCIRRPRPKGGVDRAFTVPLAAVVLDLLRRRREENAKLFPDDQGWVFPTRNTDGHVTCVQETKEQRYEKRRKVGHLPSPHRLRDTFATAGHEAKLHPMDLKILMNHTLPGGDVTAGYVRPSVDHLRDAAEAIAAFLLGRMRVAA